MPTTRLYPRIYHATLQTATTALVSFLMNNDSTYTGPGWILIEASSGTSRQTPTNSGSLASLTGTAASWFSGTMATGSWVVLESRNSNNSNHFQLYIEYNTTTSLNFMLIPFANFVTGGVATSPPTFPTGTSGSFAESTGTMMNYSIVETNMKNYIFVADEGMVSLIVDANGGRSPTTTQPGFFWNYIGELNTNRSGTDTRCYVLWDLEINSVVNNTTTRNGFNRLSPFDNLTGLTNGWMAYAGGTAIGSNPQAVSNQTAGNTRNSLPGFDFFLPIGVWFNDTGHNHFAGWMRNFYGVTSANGFQGTMNQRTFAFINGQGDDDFPCLAFRWDGRTRL